MPINDPGLEELKTHTDSPYTLVELVAKRTRALMDGAMPLVDPGERKPIAIAIDEINRGLITFHRNLEDDV
ncbi:MAG TPA: DNA-directed RNA polymerase subunit omega [Clostridiales bacterium]|jgi:DNA-directed RNA polymerase subunit omega|nr:DNA-directed RNA polymerase subunit omega [Clostridiales bacterium]